MSILAYTNLYRTSSFLHIKDSDYSSRLLMRIHFVKQLSNNTNMNLQYKIIYTIPIINKCN